MNNENSANGSELNGMPNSSESADASIASTNGSEVKRLPEVQRIAALFVRGEHGYAALPTGVSASLRRLDTSRPARSINAVISTLIAADLPVERMSDDELTRRAAFVHAVALLSGTSGKSVHRSSSNAGKAIANAGYSNARFARLLTAKGEALAQQVARLTRFLAKAPKALPIDLRPILEMLLWDGRDSARSDAARMTLARGYYTVESRTKEKD